MDYLEAVKQIYENKLTESEKIKFHLFIQEKMEKQDRKIKDIREEMNALLNQVEGLSREYINRIFQIEDDLPF